MNDRLIGAADRFERALDQRLPGLREHLNDHVVRDEVFSMICRTKSKSVCDADGKPTSISL